MTISKRDCFDQHKQPENTLATNITCHDFYFVTISQTRGRGNLPLSQSTPPFFPLKVMSKRKNPFGDTAPIQMKIHVTEKHTATEEDMQEVYSKCVE